jgi:putative DNA primase/helicase
LLDILKAEAAGILAWAVRGSLAWQKKGLDQPQAVKNATAAYRAESDHLEHFIGDCCEVEPNASVTSADLWDRYKGWTVENSETSVSQAALGERLKQRGFKDGRFGHGGTRGWFDIGLVETAQPGEQDAEPPKASRELVLDDL